MSGQSQVVGTTAQGKAVRKILSGVAFGVEHKDPKKNQGSGRPQGNVEVLTNEDGSHRGYLIEAPFFGPTQNEAQAKNGGATLAASGGYLKTEDGEFVQITLPDGVVCRIKWSGMAIAVPMTEIEKRKAEAAARRKTASK